MRELKNDTFYDILKKYDWCRVEYCLIKDDAPYEGLESHRKAIAFAMQIHNERDIEDTRNYNEKWGTDYKAFPLESDPGKAQAVRTDPDVFLFVPDILRRDANGAVFYDTDWEPNDDNIGGQIPYWYAFLEPPHGSGYTPEDFRAFNSALFPEGTDELEVYEWSTDWSNFFDDGHEWWGTGCWSIYDAKTDRYAIVMASCTD